MPCEVINLCDVEAKYLKISSKCRVIVRDLSVFLQTKMNGRSADLQLIKLRMRGSIV